MQVDQVMTRDVVTVSPQTSLKDVAALLTERRISGVPVCDEANRVLGVVSEHDILLKELGLSDRRAGLFAWLLESPAELSSRKLAARTAEDAMTAPAITTEPNRSVAEAARLMVDGSVNRLPVVENG